MLVFEERGKPKYPENNPCSKGENQEQTQPKYGFDADIWTQATLVGGECSHHYATLAPQKFYIDSASWFFVVELIIAGRRILQLSTDCSPKQNKKQGNTKDCWQT